MISFQKKIRSFRPFLSLGLLATLPFLFCSEQTRQEKEMTDFSKYVPQKTIVMEIEKQVLSELNPVPDKKNPNQKPETKTTALVNLLSPSYESNLLIVPPSTKLILTLSAYCLKSSGAGPQKDEPYRVIRVEEGNEIRKLLNSMWGQCRQRSEVQSLAWNITNRVPQSALPSSQKDMLGLSGLLQTVKDVPVIGFGVKIISTPISLTKNVVVYTIDNFAAIESEILNRSSKYELPRKPEPSRHGPFLIEVLGTNGFSGAVISVYNYTAEPAKFQSIDFQLIPERKDVQPLALELSRTLACHYKKLSPIAPVR